MTEERATQDNPIRVDNVETGMFSIGYNGQTREELERDLAHRKEQLSVIPLRRNK